VAHFEFALNGAVVPGTVILSKTQQLGNQLRVIGKMGTLSIKEGQKHFVTYFPTGSDLKHEISNIDSLHSVPSEEYYFRIQLDDFVGAIRTGAKPRISGIDGTRSLRLIEDCYRHATPLEEPWVDLTVTRLAPTSHSATEQVRDRLQLVGTIA
jgi:predicted dehydrogenase